MPTAGIPFASFLAITDKPKFFAQSKGDRSAMNTGQTIMTLGAFMLLTTILLNFYSVLSDTGDTIASGQDGILATTIATSYIEYAQGLAFDEVTDTSNVALGNPNALTYPAYLGPDGADEDSIQNFTDFDDFNGLTLEKDASGTNRRYRTTFQVHYVDPLNIENISSTRTFVKRMDVTTWRIFPPVSGRTDTLRTSTVMGYFNFNQSN
jgi:hypothetical protein